MPRTDCKMANDSKSWVPKSFLSSVLNQSPAQKGAKSQDSECICSRPLQDVLCKVCGLIFTARVRKLCPFHPRAIHLMDFQHCPKCKNTHLHEFRPSETSQSKSLLVSSTDEVVKTPLKLLQNVDSFRGTVKTRSNSLDISSSVSSGRNKDQMEDLGLGEMR